ncbi:MAG: glycosyltransferase family 4 protein [Chloroflexota bacterium]|nr:glycosyltransferase family 4 protein [Chloroflexota bacterium]
MKLFVASGIFHPESGGPATYLREILPEFLARGWDLRVLTYGSGSTDDYGYPLTRIPRQALPLRMLGYATASRPLLAWADVVYLHSLDLPLWGERRAPRIAKVVGDIAWERAIRKAWIPQTTDIDDFQTRSYDNLFAELGKAQRSRRAQAMDAIIVPSAYLKRMVVGWGVNERKVHVVYNALPKHDESRGKVDGKNAVRTHTDSTQGDARAALGLAPDEPLVLTAARLTPWKGVQHLISALQRVPDVRLLVAGDGDMLPALRAQAEEQGLAQRVVFLGNVSREQMPLYMRAADYLALYSGYEGLSHTLLEALREGTPVIASDKGGNPEVVQHGLNGLLVPYVDVYALSQVIAEAFAPGKRAALAANAHVGMERFTFARMVEETAGILEQQSSK